MGFPTAINIYNQQVELDARCFDDCYKIILIKINKTTAHVNNIPVKPQYSPALLVLKKIQDRIFHYPFSTIFHFMNPVHLFFLQIPISLNIPDQDFSLTLASTPHKLLGKH